MLCLPALRQRHQNRNSLEKADRRVPIEIIREIYNQCTRRALIEVEQGQRGHVPPTYDAEINRIKQKSGGLAIGTQIVAADDLRRFGELVMEYVHARPWGFGAFFMHQFRGTRGESIHDDDDSIETLDKYLACIDVRRIDATSWYIDMAVEFQLDDHVVWFRRDAHWLILKHLFDLDDDSARKAAEPSHSMQVDIAAQISQLAGFRYTPPSQISGDTKIKYVQCYSTEKQPTYSAGGKHKAKHLEVGEVLRSKAAVLDYFETVGSIFRDAAEAGTDGYARMECRVRMDAMNPERMNFDNCLPLLTRLLVAFDSQDWW
jgi:hypothetical protein